MIEINDSNKGLWFRDKNTLFFFGKGGFGLNDLACDLNLEICQLHQTHSDISLLAKPSFNKESKQHNEQTADGHFTDQSNRALLIKTADCIPLLMYCREQEFLVAIHAGWRGVEKAIAKKTLVQLEKKYPDLNGTQWSAVIGPHIQFSSFEVGIDVADRILGTIGLSATEGLKTENLVGHPIYKTFLRKHNDQTKCYLNLKEVLRSQLTDHKVKWNITEVDTLTNQEFASYRRSGKGAERNLSAIMRVDLNFDWDQWHRWLNQAN